MKKYIAIAFLLLYLMTTTELRQLLKFPLLVEHFSEHQSENKSITLWNFLCMHYANGSEHDADYDKDMKLPFKSHSCCSSSSFFVFLLSNEVYSFLVPKFLGERKPVANFYAFAVSSLYLDAIWQPPQIC